MLITHSPSTNLHVITFLVHNFIPLFFVIILAIFEHWVQLKEFESEVKLGSIKLSAKVVMSCSVPNF